MSQFTSTFVHESEYDGDKVCVEFRRLKRKHLAKLSPFMSKAADGEIKIKFTDQMEIMAILEELLPDVVVMLTGLKDKKGDVLKLADIIEDAYFMPLFQQWLGVLLSNSFLKVDDAKKSEAPQPAAS